MIVSIIISILVILIFIDPFFTSQTHSGGVELDPIDVEYAQWQAIQYIVKSQCGEQIMVKGCRNAFEIFLINLYEEKIRSGIETGSGWSNVLSEIPEESNALRVFKKSLRYSELDEVKIVEFVNNAFKTIPKEPIDRWLGGTAEIKSGNIDGAEVLSYRDFTFYIYTNARKMIDIAGEKAAMRCFLRYNAFLSGAMHWSVPMSVYDYLYNECGVRNEGFASPINSRLMGRKGARFCSLFEDVDAPFGSIGSYFQNPASKYEGNWFVNPPFFNRIIREATVKIISDLQWATKNKKPLTIYMISITKNRPGDTTYSLFETSDYMRHKLVLPANEHYFEKLNDKPIVAKFDSVIYIMSTETGDLGVKKIKELMMPPSTLSS